MIRASPANKYYLLLIILVVIASFKADAQQYDNKLWTSFTLNQRINKDIVVSIEQSLRFYNGWSQSEQTFTQLGLRKAFSKNIRAEFNYRFVQRESFLDADVIDHRFNLDLAFRHKFDDFRVTFRTRYQKRYRNINSSEDGDVAINYNRNKLSLKYSINKDLRIGAGSEIFYKIFYGENQFDKYRIITTLEYEILKRTEIQLAYLYQEEINVQNPETNNIISVGISYRPKRIKTRKKEQKN